MLAKRMMISNQHMKFYKRQVKIKLLEWHKKWQTQLAGYLEQ